MKENAGGLKIYLQSVVNAKYTLLVTIDNTVFKTFI